MRFSLDVVRRWTCLYSLLQNRQPANVLRNDNDICSFARNYFFVDAYTYE